MICSATLELLNPASPTSYDLYFAQLLLLFITLGYIMLVCIVYFFYFCTILVLIEDG